MLQIIVAALLLLVFSLTPVAEALHQHASSQAEIAHHSRNTDQHQLKTHSFCKLCDYLQHIGHQQTTLQTALPPVYLPASPIKYQSQVPCLVPAQVHSYANKGPPVV